MAEGAKKNKGKESGEASKGKTCFCFKNILLPTITILECRFAACKSLSILYLKCALLGCSLLLHQSGPKLGVTSSENLCRSSGQARAPWLPPPPSKAVS